MRFSAARTWAVRIEDAGTAHGRWGTDWAQGMHGSYRAGTLVVQRTYVGEASVVPGEVMVTPETASFFTGHRNLGSAEALARRVSA